MRQWRFTIIPLSKTSAIGISTTVPKIERIWRTVRIITDSGVIPPYAAFDITEAMLDEYIRVYGSLGDGKNKNFQWRYARKLAGLELLKLKASRGAKASSCKEGMVYLIGNPTWPEHLKIGMTIDIKKRLASYQTYDPFQKYFVECYDFCLDKRAAEKKILKKFDIQLEKGEWVKHSDGLKILDTIREDDDFRNKKKLFGSSSRQSKRPLTFKMSVRGRPEQPKITVVPPQGDRKIDN